MNYMTGFTFIIHMTVVALYYTVQQLRHRLIPFVIVFGLSVFMAISTMLFLIPALTSQSNFTFIEERFAGCQPLKDTKTSDRKVVLRLDDVQSYAWRDITFAMSEEAVNRNMKMVFGVIPRGLEDDPTTITFLERNACRSEIALHGWDHTEFEFMDISQADAAVRIKGGQDVLLKLLGQDPITFIPPNNVYSREAGEALNQAGFKIISAGAQGEYDLTVSAFDALTLSPKKASDVISECEKGFTRNNRCIIMLHPQDYADESVMNEQKFQEYIDLLNGIAKLDVQVVTFEELYNDNS